MKALHARVTPAFAALLGPVGFGPLALSSQTSERHADEVRQRLDAGISIYVVRELALIEGGQVNPIALRELGNRAMTVNLAVEVYLLDPDGRALSQAKRRLAEVDPEQTVANDRFGEAYFVAAISVSTAAGKSFGNGTPDAA